MTERIDELGAAQLNHLHSTLEQCFSAGDLEAHVALLIVAENGGWTDVHRSLGPHHVVLDERPRAPDVALLGVRTALGLQVPDHGFEDALRRELSRTPLPPAATIFDDDRVLLGVAAGIGWRAPQLAPTLANVLRSRLSPSLRARMFAQVAASLARSKVLVDTSAAGELAGLIASTDAQPAAESDALTALWLSTLLRDRLDEGPLKQRVLHLLERSVVDVRARLSRLPFLTPLDCAMAVSAFFNVAHPRALARSQRVTADPTIGIVTALDEEAVAFQWAFAPTTPVNRKAQGRLRTFDVASVLAADGGHHVIAHLCTGMGNTRAAGRAAALLEAFPTIKYVVMCGIAGAVPHPAKADDHVRLGDIVVSNDQGVIEFDLGKDEGPGKFTPRHRPRPPAPALLDAVAALRRSALKGNRTWLALLHREGSPEGARRPRADSDVLRDGSRVAQHPDDPRRQAAVPRVFDGPIASSNAVLKDPVKRDALRDQHGVKAVEMEGAGIAETTWDNELPGFLVVRAMCDYCNQDKNDDWHSYAAFVAAAYCRALLEVLPALESPRARG